MWFNSNPAFMREAQTQANRQSDVIKIMTVFPAYHQYKSSPTYEQMEQFAQRAGQAGYSLQSLYHIFSSGNIPAVLDTIIKELAVNWKPSGEIVEGTPETKLIKKRSL